MSLHPTPDMLEDVYETMRKTAPFKRWKLPHADDLEFHVSNRIDCFGQFVTEGAKRTIEISCVTVRSWGKLFATMGHEMCHLRENQLGVRSKYAHGRVFQKLADQVCRLQGFDRGEF